MSVGIVRPLPERDVGSTSDAIFGLNSTSGAEERAAAAVLAEVGYEGGARRVRIWAASSWSNTPAVPPRTVPLDFRPLSP
jgi:hypothetical protein